MEQDLKIESVLGSAAVYPGLPRDNIRGKMGSGIALLAAELMAGLEGDGHRTGGLILIDSRPQSIGPLRAYLERHLLETFQRLRRRLRRLRDEQAARSFSDRAMALVSTACRDSRRRGTATCCSKRCRSLGQESYLKTR